MDVTINERCISFSSEYDISTPSGNYYARKKILSFTDQIEIQSEGGAAVAHIEGEFSPLHGRHEFIFHDGRRYQFACEKLWKQVYKCEGNGETYWLYQHKGLKLSIFKDDRQIAAIEKNRIVFGSGNQYQIQVDADANTLLIVCMVITLNSLDDNDDHDTVTFDLGSIGPEERPYDPAWQPR
jgi:uncharacterized protein YxjI